MLRVRAARLSLIGDFIQTISSPLTVAAGCVPVLTLSTKSDFVLVHFFPVSGYLCWNNPKDPTESAKCVSAVFIQLLSESAPLLAALWVPGVEKKQNGTRLTSAAPDRRGQKGLEQLLFFLVDRELMRGPWVLCHSALPWGGWGRLLRGPRAKGPTWNNGAFFPHRSAGRGNPQSPVRTREKSAAARRNEPISALLAFSQSDWSSDRVQPITDGLLDHSFTASISSGLD